MLCWIISFKTEKPLKQAENLIIWLRKSVVQPHLELLCAVLILQFSKNTEYNFERLRRTE